MRKKSLAKRIIAIFLLIVLIFGGINLFWYGFKYLPYKHMAENMQLSDDMGRPKYTYTDGEYVYRLKMPGYLSFGSGFLYVVRKDNEDAAAFVADEEGNLTEKNTPHVDIFIWPKMFSETQYGVTIYEETDSVCVVTNSRMQFIPDESLSDEENDRLYALFEAHKDEIQELIKAAVQFWGEGLL